MPRTRPSSPDTTRLQDLPDACIHLILRLLGAADLAAVAIQAQDLRSSAEDSDLWEPHCLARWPGATAQLYSGSWCRVYQARARMPATFPLAADKIHALTAAAKDEAQQQRGQRAVPQQRDAVLQLAFDELMSSLSALGMAVTRPRDAALRRSPEFCRLKKDMAWWLTEQPQVVVGFVRSASEQLVQAGSGDSLGSASWRRSAMAALQELGLLAPAHPSVVNRLLRETEALERALGKSTTGNRVEQQLWGGSQGGLGVPAPQSWFLQQAPRVVA